MATVTLIGPESRGVGKLCPEEQASQCGLRHHLTGISVVGAITSLFCHGGASDAQLQQSDSSCIVHADSRSYMPRNTRHTVQIAVHWVPWLSSNTLDWMREAESPSALCCGFHSSRLICLGRTRITAKGSRQTLADVKRGWVGGEIDKMI
ncbi:hypothetical protein XA68_17713 [Ophiocordyceps unilateralis]|uniref:Uncharacterized protein n=1 Tax=Ophiocordyceps unilateralis TaxID=268505 RepID=A0A2A9PKF3_OPHUN|nr:hypothetical protein XA68_17713 [Ophiocordyceps unilateralis]